MKQSIKWIIFLIVALAKCYSEEIQPGLNYEKITAEQQIIHVLTVDPTKFNMTPARALDEGLGRESALSLSKRKNAIAAINGGFFTIETTFDGLPRGILKIDGEWYSLPTRPRGAIGWSKSSQSVLFDRILASASIKINNDLIPLEGINRERNKGEKIAYFPYFHRTTLTDQNGAEIIIKKGKVATIRLESGSSKIPSKGFVLSLADPIEEGILDKLTKNSEASILFKIIPQSSATTSEQWQSIDYIVGGTPLLIKNGEVVDNFASERIMETFITDRHARTAVGILNNGFWIFVVVDRAKDVSQGMTMPELAAFMKKLGSVQALNLDGGGSSTMVIKNKLINHPIGDKDEKEGKVVDRRISDAILILNKN